MSEAEPSVLQTNSIRGDAVAPRAARPGLSQHASPRFWAALVILVSAAGLMQVVTRQLALYTRKQPVPLLAPLPALDHQKLAPDYGLHPVQPAPLSEDIVHTLGTGDYLNIRLIDQDRGPRDPLRVAHVFISYYTGQPDPVPHVPDECVVTSGFALLSAENTALELTGVRAEDDQLPLRLCVFGPPGDARGVGQQLTVAYFFLVNGVYRVERNQVRLAQSNPFDRYAYYAKIEVRFTDGEMRYAASRDETLTGMRRLLPRLLPVLLTDHIADWETLKAQRN